VLGYTLITGKPSTHTGQNRSTFMECSS